MSERGHGSGQRASWTGVGRLRRRQCLRLALAGTVVAFAAAAAQGAPLAFEDAVALALRGPDVRVAELQLEQAALAARTAGAALSGSARSGYQLRWHDGAASGAGGVQPLSVSATLNLLPYGPSADTRARAEASLATAQRALLDARASAVITAAERWWAASRAAAAEALAAERLELAARGLEAVAVQVEAGTAGPAAEAEARLARDEAALDALTAGSDAAAARAVLGQVLGARVEALAPRGEAVALAVAGFLSAYVPRDAAALRAAAMESERVRSAAQALVDAERAEARAERDAGPTVALSAGYQATGDAGRVSVGAAWDTRSYQPSLDLSLDPFTSSAASSTVSLGVSVSIPLNSARAAESAQARAAAALASERLEQARVVAEIEIDASARTVDIAVRQLAISLERAELRRDQQASLALRASLGDVSLLELERARLDALDADLALARALDQARAALARLEQALRLDPSPALGLPFGLDDAPAMEAP
jgi:outer membrane protein